MTAGQMANTADLKDAADMLRRVEKKLRRLGLGSIAVRVGGCAQGVELKVNEQHLGDDK